MRKREKNRERKEILNALAMITQIGLSMMTCMGISFAIGYWMDQTFGTKYWVMIMLAVGIMAALRSLFILTGKISSTEENQNKEGEGKSHGGSKNNAS